MQTVELKFTKLDKQNKLPIPTSEFDILYVELKNGFVDILTVEGKTKKDYFFDINPDRVAEYCHIKIIDVTAATEPIIGVYDVVTVKGVDGEFQVQSISGDTATLLGKYSQQVEFAPVSDLTLAATEPKFKVGDRVKVTTHPANYEGIIVHSFEDGFMIKCNKPHKANLYKMQATDLTLIAE